MSNCSFQLKKTDSRLPLYIHTQVTLIDLWKQLPPKQKEDRERNKEQTKQTKHNATAFFQCPVQLIFISVFQSVELSLQPGPHPICESIFGGNSQPFPHF